MKWVETQTFSLSTAMNAIKVFERVTFEDLKKFDGMTATRTVERRESLSHSATTATTRPL